MPGIKIGRMYERSETAFVHRTLQPGHVFVDAGAHIGYYSTIAAQIVGDNGRVHAFEPDPQNCAELRGNVTQFGDTVSVHEVALSDCSGRTGLYRSLTNFGDHQLYASADRESVEVNVVTLDSVDIPAADFLKIDVQGMESHVLRGAQDLIARSPGLTGLIELSPEHLTLAGSSSDELLGLLADMGFNVFDRRRRRIDPKNYHEFAGIKNHRNLLFSRQEAV